MTDRTLSVLRGHPWVETASWNHERTAIVVRPTAASVAVRPTPGPLLAEHLSHWRHVYEYVYATGEGRHGDDLDLSGWRASDTGAPFPRDHMVEWIDHAVGLVLRTAPRVVLEVGCGSGLLAHRIHRKTQAYIGLDVAAPVVDRLRDQRLPGVRVLRAAAHELASEPVADVLRTVAAAPDCVLLNSVTQCFPSEQYLTAVIDDALDLVAPGGTVVVGDNRNLASAPMYARWLESARHPGSTEAELAARVADRLAAEEELLCAPAVFAGIARSHRRDVRIACYAKPFRSDTELTRYRYDVVFTVDAPAPTPARSLAWADLGGSVADRIRSLSGDLTSDPTVVTEIPNSLLDSRVPDAVSPADLAAAISPSWAVLLDSPDGQRLAVGPPEHYRDTLSDTASGNDCNDPFTRFVRMRLPEILTDHLEQQLTATQAPEIVVAEELTVP